MRRDIHVYLCCSTKPEFTATRVQWTLLASRAGMFTALGRGIAVGSASITTIDISKTAVTAGTTAGPIGTWTAWTARIIIPTEDL